MFKATQFYLYYLHYILVSVWSEISEACILNNDESYTSNVTTIDKCKEKCISELGDECQSIDYHPNGHCFVSKANCDSPDYQEPCGSAGYKFTESK